MIVLSFPSEPTGFLDAPAAGPTDAREVLRIRGWAIFPEGLATRVDLTVDGGPPRPARIGVDRADVARVFPGAGAIAGFEEIVDLAQFEPGTALSVAATAARPDGSELILGPVRLTVANDSALAEPAGLPVPGPAPQPRLAKADGVHRRLLIFAHDLGYGGAQLYLLDLVRQLVLRPGVGLSVVAMRDGPLRGAIERLGVQVVVVAGGSDDAIEIYEARQRQLVAQAQPAGFDLCLVNSMDAYPGADAAVRLGIPFVWAIHESYPLPIYWATAHPAGGPHPLVRRRAEYSLQCADSLVFEAQATRRLYLGHVREKAAVHLPYGVDIEAIDRFLVNADKDTVRQALGLPLDATVLLCLGTVEPRKAQTVLCQAFLQVAARHPSAVLAVVGDDGTPYGAALRQFLASTPGGDRVVVVKQTGDVNPWHLAADFLVCPSDLESLPRVVLEAMAFGTPVLASDIFGLTEVIHDGLNGYLCPPRDVDRLARSLDRLLSLPEDERRRVGQAAAATARRDHDSTRYAERLWELMEGVARMAG